jgi:hypothetical protein
MALPNEPNGFAVDVPTREIHKRHARHAASFRRTTPGGLEGLLHGREPVLCKECFPPPPKAERKTQTRTRFTAEPVKVVEKDLSAEKVYADAMAEDSADVEEPDGAADKD